MIIFYTNAGDPDFDDSMIQMVLDSVPLIDTFERFYCEQGENIPGYLEAKAAKEAQEKAAAESRMQQASLPVEEEKKEEPK